MQTFRVIVPVLGWLLACHVALAEEPPPEPPVGAGAPSFGVEIRQHLTPYNLHYSGGLPTSSIPGDAAPSPGLFQSFLSFGALAAPTLDVTRLDETRSYVANSASLGLPRGESNGVTMVLMPHAQVGAPFLNRPISFLFGGVIPVPDTDVAGKLLAGVRPEDYWLPEPYWPRANISEAGFHQEAPYYWSPHARCVFAIQAGPIAITWKKANSSPTEPSDFAANPERYSVESGYYYQLYTARYVVSTSAKDRPRRMYWTEGMARDLGKPVNVPSASVGAVNIVYNNVFPQYVEEEYVFPGQFELVSRTNRLQNTNTLWFDYQQHQILAFNREGRVFVELLGDTRSDGQSRNHLGSEVVDVFRQPDPVDVTVHLGERLTVPRNAPEDLDESVLYPEPLSTGTTLHSYYYEQVFEGTDRPRLYATRETRNQNDLQVHWLEDSVAGLRWPYQFLRYRAVWPDDVAAYSHYIRPLVANEEQAKETAVQLPADNVPVIEYQDPLDRIRGKLTENIQFFTYLDPSYPVHRTLLRYTAGEHVAFERVFSWLDLIFRSTNFAAAIPPERQSITNWLQGWDAASQTFQWPHPMTAPRVVNQDVAIGQRIAAPTGERGAAAGDPYWAGYIDQSEGTSFDVDAYKDPFAAGFDEANLGVIIPVNAIPGNNKLQVLWFRPNATATALGFRTTYWPSVMGRYTLHWPADAREIVLASNDGTGPLASLEAKGRLYYQNDASLPGYNPNEEHALMSGGQVYALRDDLNITITNDPSGRPYSSDPFVLLEFKAADGRAAMTVFRVQRERPDLGMTFDYQVEAGTVLQPPMPLAIMEKPMTKRTVDGVPPINLNREVGFWTAAGSLVTKSHSVTTNAHTTQVTNVVCDPPWQWPCSTNTYTSNYYTYTTNILTYHTQVRTTERHFFRPYRQVALQDLSPSPILTRWFYPTNVSYSSRTLDGYVADTWPLRLQTYGGTQPTDPKRFRYALTNTLGLAPDIHVVVVNPLVRSNWIVTVKQVDFTATPPFTEVEFAEARTSSAESADALIIPSAVLAAGQWNATNQYAGWRLAHERLPETITDAKFRQFYSGFTLQDRKGNVWVYRGPHGAESPSMQVQFYYKTLPGFFFPSLALSQQPPEGTFTPYLREQNEDGTYAGDPVYGDTGGNGVGDGNPLAITYRSVWPSTSPTLLMAETLTLPKRGLPAIRGQTSAEVVYQQSQIGGGMTHHSVVLHDPTREKTFELGPSAGTLILGRIPDSVKTQSYRGKTFFPNLPPHLSERFFLDPNRGKNGALVFKGQFVNAPVGEDFLLVNVLSPADQDYLRTLCLVDDLDKPRWDDAITNGLTTKLELFVEDRARPGTYIPSSQEEKGPEEVAAIDNDDVAVDSYALTATGPGVGYVTLISGNGLAFTPPEEPVQLHILKVVNSLYTGELKVVLPSNPLSEKLTLQQVTDLAGRPQDYDFQWKIAAPVDGQPPAVYQNTRRLFLGDGTWSHVPFPRANDLLATIQHTDLARVAHDVTSSVVPVARIAFTSVSTNDGKLVFSVDEAQPHRLALGNQVMVRGAQGQDVPGTIAAGTSLSNIVVNIDAGQDPLPQDLRVVDLYERIAESQPQSILFRDFTVPAASYSTLWLSVDLVNSLAAKVYIDGQLVVTANTGTSDTATSSPPTDLSPLARTYRLSPSLLAGGTRNPGNSSTHWLAVELYSQALPGIHQFFNLRLEAHEVVDLTASWEPLDPARFRDGVRAVLGDTADVKSLADQYLIMRYQPNTSTHASWVDADQDGRSDVWSMWTTPQLAEGWIKRVLAGINPFNQRVTDLFNHRVDTDVSMLTQAGPRWEGDVALNLDAINDYGLIEIYETVLRRGKMLSIGAGINYGPANDALLLAAGYLNDLYMMVGNEAWADAANPTIGIGTKDHTYGDIATALFAFKGQVPSLLEEELALVRGRDDFLQPGVETAPVYNRLFWNYTRGIDAGEVIYALNYNIQENMDQAVDGVINADDARRLFPQGQGDAYGHYLTALKGYYALLLDTDFDWVPRTEAVTVLGKPVQVDYLDERKFAAAAAAVARMGRHAFELSWRKDYLPVRESGWGHLARTRTNPNRTGGPSTRYWGADHWASRTGQGAYLHWVVGNSLLPEIDPDPAHEGIQRIDRTTVPELNELVATSIDLQTGVDSAEGGLTPLGLPQDAVPFDIDPNQVVGGQNSTHFEQIYQRATVALGNAVAAFDDAKDVTRLMRSEQDSLAEFQTKVGQQELAYEHSLIELYGTPYPGDIGPGRTYVQDYSGPDLLHYAYVDQALVAVNGLFEPYEPQIFRIDKQAYPASYYTGGKRLFDFLTSAQSAGYSTNQYIEFNLDALGFPQKPSEWTGRRASPGRLQDAVQKVILAQTDLYHALAEHESLKYRLDRQIEVFQSQIEATNALRERQYAQNVTLTSIEAIKAAYEIWSLMQDIAATAAEKGKEVAATALPGQMIFGLASGGDLTSAARAALKGAGGAVTMGMKAKWVAQTILIRILERNVATAQRWLQYNGSSPLEWAQIQKSKVLELDNAFQDLQLSLFTINDRITKLEMTHNQFAALVAQGERLQQEREIFRQRTAAVIQGYRTRDAAFRLFRNEKLERYGTLFDLSARYALLAANAYDYETGLLHTEKGKAFINRIVSSRALGVVRNGVPQYAGSNTGDPGLSSALAEMKADWDALKGRLGFNNPDAYGTTVSLRTENLRILPTGDGDPNWLDVLQRARRDDLLQDEDVRRHCMQIDRGNGLPVPGIVLQFSTTIADGINLFGRALAAGDHNFSPSSFATKVFAVGVALEGYRGMDNPAANSGAVTYAGGTSPADPTIAFLDPKALAATPYVYLIPVGVDSMRSPPLGDASVIRTWSVEDVTIPMPFNIGASEFSTKKLWQSSDSLSEPLFGLRKHQAFRPVSTTAAFNHQLFGASGQLLPSPYTNRRLIGRSVWNSSWKLVIPGHTLLQDPKAGLDRFVNTVKDVKLHFVTYSYAGN
jgi:hypothetical protein